MTSVCHTMNRISQALSHFVGLIWKTSGARSWLGLLCKEKSEVKLRLSISYGDTCRCFNLSLQRAGQGYSVSRFSVYASNARCVWRILSLNPLNNLLLGEYRINRVQIKCSEIQARSLC